MEYSGRYENYLLEGPERSTTGILSSTWFCYLRNRERNHAASLVDGLTYLQTLPTMSIIYD
jgi:hypothetical protein